MKRFMRRLKYCTSSQITPGTRRLEIYPIYGHAETPTSDGDGLLLHATLRRVPFFVNLSTVICSHLTLDSTLWNDFCGVHKLRKLKLQDCVLELGLTGPPPTFLDVGSVEILSRDLIAFPVENWVPCFHSDRIEVTIDDPRCGEFSLQRLCQSPHTMRHLRCLTTGVHQGQLPLLELLLAHSPPLRHLVLHTSDNVVLGRQTCTYIPPLDTYHGPYEFLRTLLSGESLRNMRQISITSYFTLEDPSHTLRILRELGTSTGRLEALRIPTRFLAKQVLATISFLFVHLRHLSVIHLNPNPNPPDPPDACTFLVSVYEHPFVSSSSDDILYEGTVTGQSNPTVKDRDPFHYMGWLFISSYKDRRLRQASRSSYKNIPKFTHSRVRWAGALYLETKF